MHICYFNNSGKKSRSLASVISFNLLVTLIYYVNTYNEPQMVLDDLIVSCGIYLSSIVKLY